MTYYAATQAFYERDGSRRVIPNVLIIDSDSIEHARATANEFLNDTYPAPGYFDHAFEVNDLAGVEITDDVTLIILNVAEEYMLAPKDDA